MKTEKTGKEIICPNCSKPIINARCPCYPPQAKTGKLEFYRRFHEWGGDYADYFQCVDCKTVFPMIVPKWWIMEESGIRCNGHVINKCPWCREDSKPWTNGRGI